jgi:glycerophosphoryl diester phosphodiesterase
MLIYGHRGARGEAPENTLGGFRHALAAGIERVELDLHLASDGELVVIHDPTLARTTNGRGRVARHSSAELARLDARRGGPPWPHPEGVPTLARLLEECPGFLHHQLECKPANAAERARVAERLAALFREHALYPRATVTSFDPQLLAAVAAVDPRIPRGLVCERARPEPLATARELGVGLLVLHFRLCTATRIAAAHAAGLEVSAWTVNTRELALELGARGVDSIVTDFPTRLARLER